MIIIIITPSVCVCVLHLSFLFNKKTKNTIYILFIIYNISKNLKDIFFSFFDSNTQEDREREREREDEFEKFENVISIC